MKKIQFPALLFALLSPFLSVSAIADSGVDLHQHLFMKHGMGILLRGGFDTPLNGLEWDSKFGTKANRETVESSKLGIIVVSLYVHPILSQSWAGGAGGITRALELQVAELENFVKNSNDTWIIARTAGEAKAARAEGKKVFVLSLETAAGILETDSDLVKWIDQAGVRIVTFMHLSPDHLGGVALWPGIGFLNSPLDWIRSWIAGDKDSDGHYINRTGLSQSGRVLLEKLLKRKVWIDLAHSSDQTQTDMFDILDHYQQPALYTHTSLRAFMRAERGVSDVQLKRVRETHGVIGLFPSEDMAKPLAETLDFSMDCQRGFSTLAQEWTDAVMKTSGSQVMLGSDFNSPIVGLRPGCKKTGVPDFEKNGFVNAIDVPKLWSALREMGVPLPINLKENEKAFLEAWAQVNP